ncbi:hypothetical protein BDP27DRAFT_1402152 [Rhodocollybia butyracea]|uniref:Uncharacterized protein n=1 Tax=Rhodocollybia butyracea TaxID=206335 RepID=A0A9P5PXB6_9AGAR|nr:hypothetical protein BDP27DRAFT_1402152 [Rhodocollybia butyracea]
MNYKKDLIAYRTFLNGLNRTNYLKMLYVFYNQRVSVGMPSAAATPTSEVDAVTKALLAVRLADNELTPATSAPLSITLHMDLHLSEPFLTPEANNMNTDPVHLLDPLAILEANNLDVGSDEGIPPVGNNHQARGQGQGRARGHGTSWAEVGVGPKFQPAMLAAQVRKEVLSNGNGWSKLRSFTGLAFWIEILIAIFHQLKFAYNAFPSQLCPATKKSAPSEAEITLNPKEREMPMFYVIPIRKLVSTCNSDPDTVFARISSTAAICDDPTFKPTEKTKDRKADRTHSGSAQGGNCCQDRAVPC